MIDGKSFYLAMKNYEIKYDQIQKILIGQGKNYTACLLGYVFFQKLL